MNWREKREKQTFWIITGAFCLYLIMLGTLLVYSSSSDASESNKTVREGYHKGWKTRVVREPSKAQKGAYTERGWHNGEYINIREYQKDLPTGKGLKPKGPKTYDRSYSTQDPGGG